jgi:hypothetical protein
VPIQASGVVAEHFPAVAECRLDRARSRYERALVIYEARLGADHPDTVQSRENLAAVMAALDKQR